MKKTKLKNYYGDKRGFWPTVPIAKWDIAKSKADINLKPGW